MNRTIFGALAIALLWVWAARAGEVVLDDWDVDAEDWNASLSREGERPDLIRFHLATGTLEVTCPGRLVTITRKDVPFPLEANKLSLDVIPVGTGFKEIEIGIVIQSAGKNWDILGRTKVVEGTPRQTITFPVNITQHIGSNWNKLSIRIYCEKGCKVRLDNLKAITPGKNPPPAERERPAPVHRPAKETSEKEPKAESEAVKDSGVVEK